MRHQSVKLACTQAEAARRKLEGRLAREAFPLDYSTCLRVVRDALAAVSPPPIVVSEGANTMDNARHAPILACSTSGNKHVWVIQL